MKRILAYILCCSILISGCGPKSVTEPAKEVKEQVESVEQSVTQETQSQEEAKPEAQQTVQESIDSNAEESLLQEEEQPSTVIEASEEAVDSEESVESGEFDFEPKEYDQLNDPELFRYLQDKVYDELVADLDSTEYFVDNIESVYVSKEYLEELAYNSEANIYFGYDLAELEDQFQGTKFVFSLSPEGDTKVYSFEGYDDTYEKAIQDVAIGSGVILMCVTVSVLTGGTAPAVSMIFAVSAKTGAVAALSSGTISGVASGVVTGIKTNNFDEAVKAGVSTGSKGFKWAAISGALVGGAGEAAALHGATLNGLTMNEAATIQKESKYPLDVIREFQNMEQYQVCKNADLTSNMIDGKTALIRKIDLDAVDEWGMSNLDRMKNGLAPLDPSGKAYELHHVGQKVDSTLAILTKDEHRLGDSYKIWHTITDKPGVHAQIGTAWEQQRTRFWKAFADSAMKGLI